METASEKPAVAGRRRGPDRGLLLVTLGALTLIVAGLIAIPLANRRTLALAPATTPDGAVQRFYLALQAGDYPAAYELTSADSKQKLSLEQFHQQVQDDSRSTQVRIEKTSIQGDATASVQVSLTSYSSDGLFGTGEYSYDRDLLLRREGTAWKIVQGPFYVPEK
jgi:hypothetical protein